jgi:hypothetical protein
MQLTEEIRNKIKGMLDKSYCLRYVDYRESFDENLAAVQESIHAGDYEAVDEAAEDYDGDWEAVEEILGKLKGEVEETLGVSEEDAAALVEGMKDELRETIEERDTSNPLKDLLKNSGRVVMFYDTGVETDGYDSRDVKAELRKVKRALGLRRDQTFADARLEMMILQASYGGKLVVYFRSELHEWLGDIEANVIRFKGDVSVAIVDHCNGSGDSTDFNHAFDLPFNRENLFIDSTIDYNYTYAVCGMSSDWCDGTKVTLLKKRTRKVAERSSVNDFMDREAELDAKFKAGGCTPGDMKFTRHRGVYYENNFPCGNHCPHCGTFWID